MDLKLNEHQSLIKDSVRSFILKEFPEDRINEFCLKREYPREFDKKIAELGFFGICFPEKYNGSGFGMTEVAIVMEELSRYSLDLGMSYGLNMLGGLTILNFGTEIQKNNYLPKLIKGEVSFSLGYYEPFFFNGQFRGNGYISVNTGELVITTGTIYTEKRELDKNFVLLPLKLDEGIVLVFLPQALLGEGEVLDTLGKDLLGLVKYSIKDIKDINCSKGQIVINDRERNILSFILNTAKFVNLICCIGNMRTVINETIEHARKRIQFGRPIGTFQSLQHLIVDAKMKADASELFGYWVASLIENHGRIVDMQKEINMANCYVTQSIIDVVNVGIQVMGGYGYIKENNMERYIRDSRVATYFLEDGFLQKRIIAERLGLFRDKENW